MTYIAATKPTFSDQSTFDARALRDAFGTFATGVTVVTTAGDDGAPVGFTANSFTTVSLDPPLVLVCVADRAKGYRAFRRAQHFGIAVLAANQQDVSQTFASAGEDKFAAVDWHTGVFGIPILSGATASFACGTHDWVDAGDHGILIGRVLDFAFNDAAPLCYHRGQYAAVTASTQQRMGDDR